MIKNRVSLRKSGVGCSFERRRISLKNKVKAFIEYDLLSSAISVFVAIFVAAFTGEYDPALFFVFIFPLSFVFFRYDSHRHYLTNWFYVHFKWRFHFN